MTVPPPSSATNLLLDAGVMNDADLMNVAARVAVTVGRRISVGRRQGLGSVRSKSTPTDMVTEWDTRAEQLIAELLTTWRPTDGLWAEEGSRTSGTSGITWVVDPIDGTTNFMYGLGIHAVSIAACDADGPRAAAVYVAPQRELFVAQRGAGAWLRGRRLACTDASTIDTALIATGFSYESAQRRTQIRRLVSMMPRIRDIRRIGSAAVDLCYVAAGRLDAYFEEHLHPWDYAAGMLIARESGATCTNLAGGPVDGGDLLVAGPQRHRALLALVAADS